MNTQDRYSPSFWPPTPLPLPRVETGVVNDLGDGWLGFGFDAEHQLTEFAFVKPPIEMHLREMRDVDLRDASALRELAGIVGAPVEPSQPWRGFVSPGLIPEFASHLFPRSVENIASQLGIATPEDWRARPGSAFHVSEVAYAVARVRMMTDHLERSLESEPTAPVWQRAGFFDLDERDIDLSTQAPTGGRRFDEEPAEKIAWHFFTEVLNQGLSPFSAHVIGPSLDSLPEIRDITTAYSAACVLIFNDLVEGLPYRRCNDETCGRLFRRQIGRSGGQFFRSEGVEYCTPQHARNQAQRERRRRERKQKKGNHGG